MERRLRLNRWPLSINAARKNRIASWRRGCGIPPSKMNIDRIELD